VVAVIGTGQAQGVRQALAETRRALKLRDDYEFGFNTMTASTKLRKHVLPPYGQPTLRPGRWLLTKLTANRQHILDIG
jgi:hypothetical protein